MSIEVKKVKRSLKLVKKHQGSMEVFVTAETTVVGSGSTIQNEGDAFVNEIFGDYLSSEPVLSPAYVSTELDVYWKKKCCKKIAQLDIIGYRNECGCEV
jgi:hypothetical protein